MPRRKLCNPSMVRITKRRAGVYHLYYIPYANNCQYLFQTYVFKQLKKLSLLKFSPVFFNNSLKNALLLNQTLTSGAFAPPLIPLFPPASRPDPHTRSRPRPARPAPRRCTAQQVRSASQMPLASLLSIPYIRLRRRTPISAGYICLE